MAPISLFWPLSAATDTALIERAAAPTRDELNEIVATERALTSDNPSVRARFSRAARTTIDRARRRLAELDQVVTDDQIATALASAGAARDAELALETMTDATVANDTFPGIGREPWRQLWAAAHAFSQVSAYPGHTFPHVEPGARCVLCGQTLDAVASVRLVRLHAFVRDELGEIARASREAAHGITQRFRDIEHAIATDDEILLALAEAAPDLAQTAANAMQAIRARAAAAIDAMTGDLQIPLVGLMAPIDLEPLSEEILRLDEEIRLLDVAADPVAAAALQRHLLELKAGAWVAENRDAILGEIDRLRLMEAYRVAIAGCDTHPITNHNNALTQRYVTAALQERVARELTDLNADQVRVTLAWRGERAVALHHFELRDATNREARVDDVVSEGEFGVLALAAFLAEVGQQAGRSTIVLDDPVSSLDHQFRSRVARRLIQEAIDRPVVVFTHDLVFLHDLEGAAERLAVPIEVRHLTSGHAGVGQPSEGAPWRGMSVDQRVRDLRQRLTAIRAIHASGDAVAYEALARDWYGLLRETWERAVEDILAGGAILRYRHDVQTRRLLDKRVWVLEEHDVVELDRGLTRSSAWLRGHDQPQAVNEPVPAPDDLERDALAIEHWVQDLNTRRRQDRAEAPLN